jgi:hypothetical protein
VLTLILHLFSSTILECATSQYKIDELQASLKEITPECIGSFLKSTTESSYGTAMVIGNIDAKGTEQLVSIVEDTFKFEPLAESARSRRRALLVPLSPQAVDKSTEAEAKKAAGYRIARAEPNEQDDNSAVAFYFQMPSRKYVNIFLNSLIELPSMLYNQYNHLQYFRHLFLLYSWELSLFILRYPTNIHTDSTQSGGLYSGRITR